MEKETVKSIHKIAVLTSGGDAPGMNATIRSIVRAGIDSGLSVYGIEDGYRGLVEGRVYEMDRNAVTNIINRGGTILGSARLPEFSKDEVAQIAVEQLHNRGIEAVITIGGDGTYRGALKLTQMGINCVGVPGTIDNDIASTEFTIGFDTAVNTAVDAIDKLRDTSNSHQRCSIVEVMGRYCGDIAYAAALATGADLVITSETGFDLNEVIDTVKRCQGHKSRHVLIVITEHDTDVMELAKKIKEYTGFDARATILGHIQRGGSPSPFDRVLATRLGIAAVDELIKGNGGVCMGIFKNKVVATPIEEALTMKKQMFKGYKEMTKRVS